MADYAFFRMLVLLAKGILALLVLGAVIFLIVWICGSFRRHAKKTLIALCCSAVVLVLVAVIAVVGQSPPSEIAQRTGAIPLPDGLTVLHGRQNSGFDSAEVWLHFTMAPTNLAVILSSGTYTRLASCNLDFDAYGPPQWWDTNRFTGCLFYQCASGPAMGYDASGKHIVVNAAKTEALLLMRCWND